MENLSFPPHSRQRGSFSQSRSWGFFAVSTGDAGNPHFAATSHRCRHVDFDRHSSEGEMTEHAAVSSFNLADTARRYVLWRRRFAGRSTAYACRAVLHLHRLFRRCNLAVAPSERAFASRKAVAKTPSAPQHERGRIHRSIASIRRALWKSFRRSQPQTCCIASFCRLQAQQRDAFLFVRRYAYGTRLAP